MKSIVLITAALAASTAAQGATLGVGMGKILNNANTSLPGYTAGVFGSTPAWHGVSLDGSYLRIGKSELAEDMAITSAGFGYQRGRWHLSVNEILVAAANPAVWWFADDDGKEGFCQIGGKNDHRCKRYKHGGDGSESRACRNCGEDVSLRYTWPSGFGIKIDYYGLLHMKPTFQGVGIQVTYAISN